MSPSVSAVASAERIAEAKQFDDTTLGIKRSHGGRIKTRLANKSNTVLWITLGILAAVTVFTFIIMDYGKIPMVQAVPAALEDFATMLTLALVGEPLYDGRCHCWYAPVTCTGSFDDLHWRSDCLFLWSFCCDEFV